MGYDLEAGPYYREAPLQGKIEPARGAGIFLLRSLFRPCVEDFEIGVKMIVL